MIVLGLTGSIGMGKSTTAGLFADAGAAVFDADLVVHALYAPGGAAVGPIAKAFPGSVLDGAVDRKALAVLVAADPTATARLEAIVHPLVRDARDAFLTEARAAGAPVAVLDIPLLFETGMAAGTDGVVVVTASPTVQRARVLARPGMTEETFRALLARQLSDGEKRRRADFLIHTDRGIEDARRQVAAVLRTLEARVERPH